MLRLMLNVDIELKDLRLDVVPVLDSRANFGHRQNGQLCSFLTLYRLVDIMAWLKGVGNRAPVVGRSPELLPSKESLPVCCCLFWW